MNLHLDFLNDPPSTQQQQLQMPERQVLPSLSGAAAPLLTTDPADSQSIDDSSMFVPRAWKKVQPFVIDEIQLQPLNVPNLGQQITWEVPKLAHYLFDLAVDQIFPPAVIAPAGNPAAYVDFLGLA